MQKEWALFIFVFAGAVQGCIKLRKIYDVCPCPAPGALTAEMVKADWHYKNKNITEHSIGYSIPNDCSSLNFTCSGGSMYFNKNDVPLYVVPWMFPYVTTYSCNETSKLWHQDGSEKWSMPPADMVLAGCFDIQ